MITLVSAYRSAGFNSIYRGFTDENISPISNILSFPENNKTEIEIFEFVNKMIEEYLDHKIQDVKYNIFVLTNSLIVKECFRHAIFRGELPHTEFQALFIAEDSKTFLQFFDKDARSDDWQNGNLDLSERICMDLISPSKTDLILNKKSA